MPVSESGSGVSPHGNSAAEAGRGRARRSHEYQAARQEYAVIRTLREKNWIAAHIRERRYELDLTQQEVARRADTSHSFISKIESGRAHPDDPGAQADPRGARRAAPDRHRAHDF